MVPEGEPAGLWLIRQSSRSQGGRKLSVFTINKVNRFVRDPQKMSGRATKPIPGRIHSAFKPRSLLFQHKVSMYERKALVICNLHSTVNSAGTLALHRREAPTWARFHSRVPITSPVFLPCFILHNFTPLLRVLLELCSVPLPCCSGSNPDPPKY